MTVDQSGQALHWMALDMSAHDVHETAKTAPLPPDIRPETFEHWMAVDLSARDVHETVKTAPVPPDTQSETFEWLNPAAIEVIRSLWPDQKCDLADPSSSSTDGISQVPFGRD